MADTDGGPRSITALILNAAGYIIPLVLINDAGSAMKMGMYDGEMLFS